MYSDGYKNIVNTDYSPVVIERMRARYTDTMPDMTWLEMDINKLAFDDCSFDCVLEKGTIDALLVDETDPWCLSMENAKKLDNILKNVGFIFKKKCSIILLVLYKCPYRCNKPIEKCSGFVQASVW